MIRGHPATCLDVLDISADPSTLKVLQLLFQRGLRFSPSYASLWLDDREGRRRQSALQFALSPILYIRDTLGDSAATFAQLPRRTRSALLVFEILLRSGTLSFYNYVITCIGFLLPVY